MTANDSVGWAGPNRTVFVTMTTKGGAGKTETADVLEAVLTLGGQTCRLVDVDDGNRGLASRVGIGNVVKAPWTNTVAQAPSWVDRHAKGADSLVFDLGAGIESADLPIVAFLSTVWRLLHDEGARIVFCAVVSTNAHTSMFIERINRNYGALGEVVTVYNNQDGSRAFPDELLARPEPKIWLRQLPAGVQAVRLARPERLSEVIRSPAPGYHLATAMMANRIVAFAEQPVIRDAVGTAGLERLRGRVDVGPPPVLFSISQKSHATDEAIQQNARVAAADRALRDPALDDPAVLRAALIYRKERQAWQHLARSSG